jgi:plasmid stabilization system protein ParE
MKIEWSDDALADLDRFATFLRETYPALAERVARELVSKAADAF